MAWESEEKIDSILCQGYSKSLPLTWDRLHFEERIIRRSVTELITRNISTWTLERPYLPLGVGDSFIVLYKAEGPNISQGRQDPDYYQNC